MANFEEGQWVTVTFTGVIRSVFPDAVTVDTLSGSDGYFLLKEASIVAAAE